MKNLLLKMATYPANFYEDRSYDKAQTGYVDFRALLGEAAWQRLVPAVRERFSNDHSRSVTTVYTGQMNEISCNAPGWFLAQACRLLGTPLTSYSGRNIPTSVHVYDDENNKGTVWERRYRFPGIKPLQIRSSKCLDRDKSLLESVDGGVRMRLHVYEKDGQLIFVSTRYFLELVGFRIPIPEFFTPGKTKVVHTDLGAGDFRFTLSMKHPFFGRMFYQDGIFRLEEKQK